MSLLDGGDIYEPCNVYMEVHVTDADGNIVTRASDTPIPATAFFEIQNQSGTSSRRAETDVEGNSTEQVLLMTVPRAWTAQHGVIQAQAEIGWGLDSKGREKRWGVFGEVINYAGSARTRHLTYTLRRT